MSMPSFKLQDVNVLENSRFFFQSLKPLLGICRCKREFWKCFILLLLLPLLPSHSPSPMVILDKFINVMFNIFQIRPSPPKHSETHSLIRLNQNAPVRPPNAVDLGRMIITLFTFTTVSLFSFFLAVQPLENTY